MKLFEYAVIYVPEDDEGRPKKSEARILVEPTTVLAADASTVNLMAAKQIPEDVDLEFVQVVVRPF